ncbi:membrane protein [Lentilactobacillus fungorum]|uniref:Membrane protein n=1 Tax=Lentilactobacillus fungorum TaxID=2201250 RepID=A0ABQ3W5E8_9LACO|nr:DUF1700 domain-containing protein [Lentilactobacillus fungorum]GHP14634.1 membrane protein [Lentilactobacillus fungorum]
MDDYIEEFRTLLGQLDQEERDEAVNFYEEYLEDGHFTSYNDCVRELGTPRQLARKVLADYSIKTLENPQPNATRSQRSKNDVKTIWLILLALLSTPVTIPLAIVAAALFIAGIAVTGALIISIAAVFFAAILTGVVSFAVGIGIIINSFWTGLFYLGIGLFVIGFLIILTPMFKAVVNGLIRGVTLFSKWIYNKLVPKNRAERRERKGQR